MKKIFYILLIIFVLSGIVACSDEGILSQQSENLSVEPEAQIQQASNEPVNSENMGQETHPPVSQSANAQPQIFDLPEDSKSAEYTIRHDKDETTYTATLTKDSKYNYTLQLFDSELNQLQSLDLGTIFRVIEFTDVNLDGYTDIVTNTGGTINETHDLYIWDSLSNSFTKVIYEGSYMLAWFTVHEGYIENFIRGGSPEESIKEKLIWKGNTLIKESEDGYELED